MTENGVLRSVGTYALSVAPIRPRRFLVLCPPRSGSELLVSLLEAHPDIRCEGEIFKEAPTNPWREMDGRAALARLRGAKAWGCKILGQQLRWYEPRFGGIDAFLSRAVDEGTVLVHLSRRDLIAQVLSGLHAEQAQHHYRVGEVASFQPMELDPVVVVSWLYNLEDNARWLDEALADLDTVSLVYEDALTSPSLQQATVNTICEGLELPPATVTTDLVQVAPRSPADRVANWDEVADVLSRTRFRSLLQ